MGKIKGITLGKIKSNRPFALLLLLYSIFLLVLPRAASIATPCLSDFSINPSVYQNCTLTLALDRFILFAFIGFLLIDSVAILFLNFTKKQFYLLNILMAVMIVIGYYLYIPQAWGAVVESEVYLDSLYESGSGTL